MVLKSLCLRASNMLARKTSTKVTLAGAILPKKLFFNRIYSLSSCQLKYVKLISYRESIMKITGFKLVTCTCFCFFCGYPIHVSLLSRTKKKKLESESEWHCGVRVMRALPSWSMPQTATPSLDQPTNPSENLTNKALTEIRQETGKARAQLHIGLTYFQYKLRTPPLYLLLCRPHHPHR